jgi:hypothetical protein
MRKAAGKSAVARIGLRAWHQAGYIVIEISDDGRGLFDKINESFALDEPHLAMLELSKGKLTSAKAASLTTQANTIKATLSC